MSRYRDTRAELLFEYPREPRERGGIRSNPRGILPEDEPLYETATGIVEGQKHKPRSKFTGGGPRSDWGLVMHIFKGMKAQHSVTSRRTQMYCLMPAGARATPKSCTERGALVKTKGEIGDLAARFPPGKYRAHVVYVDERDCSVTEMTGEHTDVLVEPS